MNNLNEISKGHSKKTLETLARAIEVAHTVNTEDLPEMADSICILANMFRDVVTENITIPKLRAREPAYMIAPRAGVEL